MLDGRMGVLFNVLGWIRSGNIEYCEMSSFCELVDVSIKIYKQLKIIYFAKGKSFTE